MSDPELSIGREEERGREDGRKEGCNHRNSEVSQGFLFLFSISEHTQSSACMDARGKRQTGGGSDGEGKKKKVRSSLRKQRRKSKDVLSFTRTERETKRKHPLHVNRSGRYERVCV